MVEQWVFESIAYGIHNCAIALGIIGTILGIFLFVYAFKD